MAEHTVGAGAGFLEEVAYLCTMGSLELPNPVQHDHSECQLFKYGETECSARGCLICLLNPTVLEEFPFVDIFYVFEWQSTESREREKFANGLGRTWLNCQEPGAKSSLQVSHRGGSNTVALLHCFLGCMSRELHCTQSSGASSALRMPASQARD